MKTAVRVLVGMMCGPVVGGPVLYLFSAVLVAIGMVNAHSLSLKANLDAELVIMTMLLGAVVAIPGRARMGAAVGGICLTLLTVAISISNWHSPGALQASALLILIMGVCGGTAFGALVNGVSGWVGARVGVQGGEVSDSC